ncbi:hypothetical protein CLAIMM_06008 [Cladophialophora immunda]|nr:hypothetical protein CLAIMM_06008 [Cladophialophora immunda]
MERADEEPDLRSTTTENNTAKNEGSSPTTAAPDLHQTALVDTPSIAALDRQINIASVWQLLQIYLMQRMGSVAARFIRETGALKVFAVLMLGFCTYLVILSLARLEQAWNAAYAFRTVEREDPSLERKSYWFKLMGNVAFVLLADTLVQRDSCLERGLLRGRHQVSDGFIFLQEH